MKLKDKTQELYEDIKLNDEQSNKILNKILNNQKRFKFKIIHLTPVLIVVAIFIAASFINIKNIEYVMATEKIISSSTMGVEIFERERKNRKGEPYKVQVAKVISIATNMDLNPNANLPVIKNSDFHSTKPDKHTQYKIKDLEKKDKRLNRQFKLLEKKEKEIKELKEDNKHQWEERCKLTFHFQNKQNEIDD